MGTLYQLDCLECGFSLVLRQGVGMMFFDHQKLLQLLPDGERTKIQELLEGEGAALEGFSYRIFSCPDCQRQESYLAYQIGLGGGGIYRPAFHCSHCGGPLAEDDQIRPLETCPECGSGRLITGLGEWD